MVRCALPVLLLATTLGLAACVSADTRACGDGFVCPEGTACKHYDGFHDGDPPILVCVADDAIAACAGDGARCTLDGAHACYAGACLATGCGNRVPDPGETCDDGNRAAGDGCSPDCTSDERCGTGRVDPQLGEDCDDGNHVAHDGCASDCRDEALAWTDMLAGIGHVDGAQPIYDAARDTAVMFGGEFPTGVDPQTTLEFRSRRWVARRPASAPTPRNYGMLAYAADRGRAVLFSGASIADTWEYDGVAWTELAPAHVPPARGAHAMVNDPVHHRVVMVSGEDVGDSQLFYDTWTWDGTDWTELGDGTAASGFAKGSIGFDPERGIVVGFGSTDGETESVYELGAGDAWTQVAGVANTPGIPFEQTAQWDPVDRVFVFATGTTSAFATYDPRAKAWGTLAVPDTTAIYTPLGPTRAGELLALGGDVVWRRGADRTWTLVRGPMIPVAGTPLHLGFDVQGATDAAHQRTYLVGESQPWLWLDYWSALPAMPVKRAHVGVAIDALGHLVVFGGDDGTGALQPETFVFDGTAWATAALTGPPSQYAAPMVFDAARGRVVLYTGHETWAWDGTAWARLAADGPDVYQPAIAYDAARGALVLVGSLDGQTWEWSDATALPGWTAIAVTHPPNANGHALQLAYDAGRARVMAHNGLSTFSYAGGDWHVERVGLGAEDLGSFAFVEDPDGAGILKVAGRYLQAAVITTQRLRWDSGAAGGGEDEACDGTDLDGDGLRGCADPDCACAATCGDATCEAGEDPLRCPGDCAWAAVCGDAVCAPGETCAGDCAP